MRISVVVLALALTGCATTGGGRVDLKAIQAQVRAACSFVPTIQTIAAIINASAGSAFTVVAEICGAVTSIPLADGGTRKVMVRGVIVKGKRVK